MSKSNTLENAYLGLLFNATAIPNIADNAGSAPLTNLYMSLHTASPTDSGTQSSSEVAYTGYARVAVARSGSGWTVSGNSVSPTANVEFGPCTGLTATATHVGIGSASASAGVLYYYGALSPTISISAGVTPRITTASTITEE